LVDGPALAQPVIMTRGCEKDGDSWSRSGILFRASSGTRSPSAIAAFRNAVKLSLPLAAALLIAGPAVAADSKAAAPIASPPLTIDEVPNGEDEGTLAAAPAGEPVPEVEGTDVNPTHDDVSERMSRVEQELAATHELVVRQRSRLTIGGYIDAGFFSAGGNGSGVIQDLGPKSERLFPQYFDHYGWVFLGDLLAPAINSRGEAADLGNLPNTDRFDSVHSGGAPGFIINEVNLTLNVAIADSALATASMDFLPRSGLDFRLGDVFEVDLAQLEWMPTADRRTSIFVGKMESVLGIEYRERKASQRFGVTPSLISRYTTGTPLGIKVRSKLGANDRVIVAAALTNGSSTTETFHFYDEIDSNAGKTGSARISVAPIRDLEVGLSGEYGPQDHAQDSRDPLWFAGIDAEAQLGRVDLKAQWLMGRGAGETGLVYTAPHQPYGLRLNGGGYLEADVVLTGRFGFLLRAEYRDALVWLGDPASIERAERIYVSKVWRATGGVRFTPSEHVTLKAEYLHNGEYGGIPSIPDDVFTSSLILWF
jgi:hypothetical protein